MPIPHHRLAIPTLAAAIVIWSALLWGDLAASRVDLNDNVSHFALIERIVSTLERGGNPLDTWSPEWTFGFPVLRVYQPLAHLLVAGLYFACFKTVPLMTVFVWVRFLAVVLLPVSFYAAARLMELPRAAALAAALASPLLSSAGLFGLEFGSYVWAGSGLFPQSLAAHLLLLSLGCGYRAVRRGPGYTLAGALLGLTFLAHLIYGYMGALSLCLLALLPGDSSRLRERFPRTARLGAVALALSLFQLLPLAIDAPILNHSRWEPAWKWDGFGAAGTLGYLFRGELLDANRWPVLSLAAAAGLVLVAWRWRTAPVAWRFAAAGAALWTLLLFGRPFWGAALRLLAISPDMQLHRVAAGAQIFFVLLAAIAFAELFRRRRAAAALMALAVLAPAGYERARYLRDNAAWSRENLAAFAAASPALDATIARVRELGGRVYTGVPAGWGGQHKIGSVPFFAFLSVRQVPAVAYLYHALALPADIQVRLDDWRPAQYRLFAIRSVVAPAGIRTALPPFWRRDQTIGRFDIFTIPGNGYFDVVDAPQTARVDKATFYEVNDRWFESDSVEKGRHLLLDFAGETTPPAPLPEAPGPPGAVAAERETAAGFEAQVDAARPAWVLFKMTWHPNWHASLDGARVSTAMLSPGFLGVAVPPGRHTVTLRYRGSSWKLWLALAGVLAVAGARGVTLLSHP